MKKSFVKTVALLLCLVMAIGFAGCKSSPDTPQTSEPATSDKPESPAADGKTAADMVLKNGVIYTMDKNDSVVTALAVVGDELVYVGDDDVVEAYIGDNTKVIDLEGKMVTPGFIAGHDHLAAYETNSLMHLVFDMEDPSIEAYTEALRAYIEAHPERDAISAQNLDLQIFPNSMATNDWLNEAFPDIPIFIQDVSGHGKLVNQAGMELMGITNDTKDPSGGTIYRDANGNMTGYFSDCSILFDDSLIVTPLSEDEILQAYEEFQALANSYGLTAMDDGGISYSMWDIMDRYSKTGNMSMRLTLPCYDIPDGGFAPMTADLADEVIRVLDEGQKYNSDYLVIKQVKTVLDGVPEGKTALLLEPYTAEAEMGDDYTGPVYWEQDELNEFVARINAAGYSVLIHSMGDGGCHKSITAFKYALDKNGANSDVRNVVVHATLMAPEDIKLGGEMGTFVATQPVWFYIDPQFGALEMQMLGEERFMSEYPSRDEVDAGLILTGGADYPVTPDFSPLSAIECGVTRSSPYADQQDDPTFVRDASQALTVYEMLKVYTINCAKQAQMENMVGSLEVGKKADMVVLAKDLTTINPVDISETEIVYTIFGGQIVYKG